MLEHVTLPKMSTWKMNSALAMAKKPNPAVTDGVLPHGAHGKPGALAMFLAAAGNNDGIGFAATKGHVMKTTILIAVATCNKSKIAMKTLFVVRGKIGQSGMNPVVPAQVTIQQLQKHGQEML
jgi:hypothetical protein